MQIVFRKISDVKREEEELQRRKNEAPLDLPPDHPVRRLFQRFRQQREARLASQRLNQGVNQGVSQGGSSDVEKGASCTSSSSSSTSTSTSAQQVLASTSIVMVTESLVTPSSSSSSRQPTPAPPSSAPPTSAPQSTEPPRPRGWGRLREAGSWSSVSKAESMETLAGRSRSQDHQGGAPLRKTDSCDSGITKSDLRLDSVGGARTPQEHSPVQSEAKRPFGGPIPEQGGHAPPALPHHHHASCCCSSSSWQELRGDIGALGTRMAALEAQLAEVLQLLRRPQDSDKDTFS